MIDKNLIRKMVDSINHQKIQKIIDNNIMHVEREWFFGVLFGFILLGFGVWWSANSYMSYSNILVSENNDPQTPVVYRKNMIDQVLNDFKKREVLSEGLQEEMMMVSRLAPINVINLDSEIDNENQTDTEIEIQSSLILEEESNSEEILPIEIGD